MPQIQYLVLLNFKPEITPEKIQDPEHEKFKEEIFSCLEDFVIFDYEL
jgi:hypothetical protein